MPNSETENLNGKEAAAYLGIPYESFRWMIRRGSYGRTYDAWTQGPIDRMEAAHNSHRANHEFAFTKEQLDTFAALNQERVDDLRKTKRVKELLAELHGLLRE